MADNNMPLAERVRPGSLDDFIGQEHLVQPPARYWSK
jgi:replication-associated recombination protein RarA